MTAIKQGTNIGLKYIVSTSPHPEKDAGSIVSRIKSNFLGTKYHVYNGVTESEKNLEISASSQLMATVTYVKIFFKKRQNKLYIEANLEK